MNKYIWQNSQFPNFTYGKDVIMPLLSSVRLKQGILLGKMQSLGFENSQKAKLNVLTEDVIKRTEFWKKNKSQTFNERQIKILTKLLDNFEGNLTAKKWAKICNCSHDTANRDLADLVNKNILKKQGEARATHYILL